MARARTTDFYQAHKFHIVDANAGDTLGAKTEGSFATLSMPDVTLAVAEYKEGIHTWVRKFPATPTVSDVTMTQGVAKNRTRLWAALLAAINGNEYRSDFIVHVFHRDDYLNGVNDLSGDLTILPTPAASRRVKLKQAFFSMVKPIGDLDSRADEILIAEATLVCESFEIIESGNTIGALTGIKPA